jgi:hypothetical protein
MKQGQAISRLQTLRDQDSKLAAYLQVSPAYISGFRWTNTVCTSRLSEMKMLRSETLIFPVSCLSRVSPPESPARVHELSPGQCNGSPATRY